MNEKSHKIVVVDDHIEIAEALKELLERKGYDVTIAHDGEQGLEIIRETVPDLVFLDVTMPKMDGRDVLTKLKTDDKTSAIPVIFLSGRDEDF